MGFLYNNGTAEICDLKLKPLNAPGLTALWPDWASDASYERYFNLRQVRPSVPFPHPRRPVIGWMDGRLAGLEWIRRSVGRWIDQGVDGLALAFAL